MQESKLITGQKPRVGLTARLLLAGVVFLVLPFVSEAQLPPDSTVLPVVVVTATRVDSAPTSATAATTMLSGDELRRRGINRVADALRLVPGAAVVQSGSPGSETGLFMRGGERDFLLVLMDGVPLNEPGGFINLANISLDNVDRIEVVRGPVSVLYGSDAISGVVQIFTRRPESGGGSHAEAYVAAGTERARSAELSLRSGGGMVGYSFGAARYATDGIYDLNNRSRNGSYSGNVSLRFSDRTRATFAARATDGQYNYPTSFWGEPLDSNSYNFERRLTTGLTVSSQLSEFVDAAVDVGYRRQSVIFADPADGGTPFPFDSRGRNERRTGGIRVNYRGWSGSVLTGGVEYELQNSASEGGNTPAEDPLLERWTRAVFAQFLSRSAGNIDAALGVRLDDNQRFGEFLTWRAAAGVPIGEATRLRGAVGTGFREPSFAELSGGGFAKPNSGLEPERTVSGEVSLEHSLFASRLSLSATWFHQVFRDLVRFASLDDDPEYSDQYQNFERASSRGLELEARTQLTSNLRMATAFTLLRTKLEGSEAGAGGQLPRRPASYGSAAITWDVLSELSLDGVVTYVGRRNDRRYFADFTSQEERLGGYAKLDLTGRYELPLSLLRAHSLELTGRVENALNRRYEAVAGFESPGRRFLLGVRLSVDY